MRNVTLLFLVLLTLAGAAVFMAAEPKPLAWTDWELIPVYHQGRVMPLDTFSRMAVEVICKRTNPTLTLKGAVSERELKSPAFAEARSLFPDDEERRFTSSELLFSWLVEPEKWDDVPFLIAEHDELREELLDVPVVNEEGEHLKYVSPRQVEDADLFHERLQELRDRQLAAGRSGEEFKLDGVDVKVDALWQAYRLYRQLTFATSLDPDASRQFEAALKQAVQTWVDMRGDLAPLAGVGQQQLTESYGKANDALEKLARAAGKPRVTLAELESSAAEFAASTRDLARWFATAQDNLGAAQQDLDDEQRQNISQALARLSTTTGEMAAQADRVLLSIYQNGDPLRVVPALNAPALESDRDTADLSQPWLDLQTLLTGRIEGLRDWPQGRIAYPRGEVEAVRLAFKRASSAYQQRDSRPNDFARNMKEFRNSLRELSEAVEPLRRELTVQRPDEDLLTYTAYPAAGYIATEHRYNRLDPFMWSWIISLGAVLCFSLNFGVLRHRMLWAGVAVLAFGLLWTMYGFYLRVAVTRWAPVTNMYETVIYVPFFVSMLGAWFLLLPLTWPGLKNAWRLTAIPGIWESAPLTSEQKGLMNPAKWLAFGVVIGVPRLVLMWLTFWILAIAEFYSGGRHILYLLPSVDIGQTIPDMNDFMVWFFRMIMLVGSVWFVPRVLLTGLLGLVFVPWTLRKGEIPASKLVQEVYPRWPFGLAATFVAFFGGLVAWYSPVLDKEFSPLQPVLRDNFWLLIHVLTIVSSYGAGALAWGLGNLALGYYLFGKYRKPASAAQVKLAGAHQPASGTMALSTTPGGQIQLGGSPQPAAGAAALSTTTLALAKRPPEQCAALSGYTYKAVQVAVLLLAAGTILGGLWADVAWGRFWGWDPKEVWALISCLVYLAVLHGRYAGLVGNFGLAAGAVIGASMIVMSWYGVNFVLGAGLHSYGFGAGGQQYVLAFVLANWWFLWLAGLRYMRETAQDSTAISLWIALTVIVFAATLATLLAYNVPEVGEWFRVSLEPLEA